MSWGKPATAKNQRWPLSVNSRVTRFLDGRRDEQRLTIQCGIGGCLFEFAGRYVDVIGQRDEHRKAEHPTWTAPKRKSKGKW